MTKIERAVAALLECVAHQPPPRSTRDASSGGRPAERYHGRDVVTRDDRQRHAVSYMSYAIGAAMTLVVPWWACVIGALMFMIYHLARLTQESL